jgi:hypothetical protein
LNLCDWFLHYFRHALQVILVSYIYVYKSDLEFVIFLDLGIKFIENRN